MKIYSIHYEVVYCSQVLKRGDWDEPDCDWDWRFRGVIYPTLLEAKKVLARATLTADTPIVRLYEVTTDRYGEVDRKLLDEKS